MPGVINSHYAVNVSLLTRYAEQPVFDAEMFLVDSEQIPVDQRFRVITQDSVSDLPANSIERNFATAYYGQSEKSDRLVLARYVSAALPPAFICGTVSQDLTAWKAITAGSFVVHDSDANSVTVNVATLASITAVSQAITKINEALAALESPAVVGLAGATISVDALGRYVLKMPSGQDDTDPTVYIAHNASSGTIAYMLGLTTATDGTVVEGVAVETYLESYDAVKPLVDYYNVTVESRGVGADDTEVVELAQQINTERKQLTVVTSNPDAYASGDSTDLQSLLSALSLENVTTIFTMQTDYPDAAADGIFLPADPGRRSYGHTPLAGVLPSGDIGTHDYLSDTEVSVLDDKGYNYIVYAGGFTYLHPGLTANGKEKRMVEGKHWIELTIQAGLLTLDMSQDLLAFDDFTLGGIESILRQVLDEAVTRRLITSYEITLPEASAFTAAIKATHRMELSAFRAVGNSEAHTFSITGTISL